MSKPEFAEPSLDALIVRTPGICGGRPRIRDHRIAVHRIAGWWKLGLTADEILEELPSLEPAEIHAALAFYHLNRSELDKYLEEENAAAKSLETQHSAA